ncbi:hypothetical protein ALC62_06867, partial [Cyphomyrmex costatus]
SAYRGPVRALICKDRMQDCGGRDVFLEGSFNLSVRSPRRNVGDVSSELSALLEDSPYPLVALCQVTVDEIGSICSRGCLLSAAVLTISAAVSRIDLTASRSPGSRGSLSIQSSTLERSTRLIGDRCPLRASPKLTEIYRSKCCSVLSIIYLTPDALSTLGPPVAFPCNPSVQQTVVQDRLQRRNHLPVADNRHFRLPTRHRQDASPSP